MANVMLDIFDGFSFSLHCMSPDVPAFEVFVLTSDFKFLIGVNEYW